METKKIELNNLRTLFCGFLVGLSDLKTTNGFVPLIEVLNPYRLKVLPIGAQNAVKKAKINILSISKGFGTDTVFIEFQLDNKALDFIFKTLRPSDRAYRKYKLEFTKSERSLIWRLRNQPQDIHKDIWEEDGVPAWENQPQKFLSEAEWRWELQMERKRKRKIQISYIRTLKKVGDVETWRRWERVVRLFS